jgi:transposase
MAWTPATRPDYERATGRYTSDVTNEEWALIAPLLPPPKKAKSTPDGGLARDAKCDLLLAGYPGNFTDARFFPTVVT